jgi:hypothetical protein
MIAARQAKAVPIVLSATMVAGKSQQCDGAHIGLDEAVHDRQHDNGDIGRVRQA